jgi:hypothetical protein
MEIILRPDKILVPVFTGTAVATAGTAALGTEEPGLFWGGIVVLTSSTKNGAA